MKIFRFHTENCLGGFYMFRGDGPLKHHTQVRGSTIFFWSVFKTRVSWYLLLLTSLSLSISLSPFSSPFLAVSFPGHTLLSPCFFLTCFFNILKTDGHSQGDVLCNDHIPGAIWARPQLSHKASSLHRRIINAKTHFHCKKEAVFGAIPSPHTTYSYILSILFEKDKYFNCFLLLLMMLLLLLLLFQ